MTVISKPHPFNSSEKKDWITSQGKVVNHSPEFRYVSDMPNDSDANGTLDIRKV